MSARNELAELADVIRNSTRRTLFGERYAGVQEIADAILAAGYRKSRTISTVEELDTLPNTSVILDAMNYCRESVKVSDGNIWRAMGPASVRASREIPLPATVLREGTQP